MSWFKIDDKFHDHPKARRAGKAAVGVWCLAGAWCADHLTDGFVPADVLPRWGTKADARRLVDAGLWEDAEHEGVTGWRFRKWEKYQPTRADVKARREVRAAAGRAGGRASGAARREALASAHGEASASPIVRTADEPPSRPDPSSQSVTQVSHLTVVAPSGFDDDGLDRIANVTGGGRDHAARVARRVLDKAGGEVRDPVRYVLSTVTGVDRAAYRYTPRLTPDLECPEHPGEWAAHCRPCASERKAGMR